MIKERIHAIIMNQKNNTEAPTYNSKLYATCQYILDNTDLFNDHFVESAADIYQPGNKYSSLHNSLKNSFDFLTGKSNINKEGLVKGSDVMPSLMLENLPEEKLAVILNIFCEYTNKNPKNTKRLFNINTEKYISLIDSLIEKINFDYLDDLTKYITVSQPSNEREQLKPNDYCKALDRIYNDYRKPIIKELKTYLKELSNEKQMSDASPIALSFYLEHSLDFYHKTLFGDHTSSHHYFRNLTDIYYACLYCDLCCYSLLQYITQLLVSKRLAITPEMRETLNSIILDLIQEYRIQDVEPQGTPEEILFYFTFYYYKKDLFYKILIYLNLLLKIVENEKIQNQNITYSK